MPSLRPIRALTSLGILLLVSAFGNTLFTGSSCPMATAGRGPNSEWGHLVDGGGYCPTGPQGGAPSPIA
eukprot:1069296-Alexandrium_andersonii.AAC.1